MPPYDVKIRLLAILALPIVATLATYAWSVALTTGRFEHWRSLGQPPEPAIEVTADSSRVVILAASGATYMARRPDTCQGDCWKRVDLPTGRSLFADQRPVAECLYVPSLPAEARLTGIYCEGSGIYSSLTAFGLMPDGSIQYWTFTPSEFRSLIVLFLTGLAAIVSALLTTMLLKSWLWRFVRVPRALPTPPPNRRWLRALYVPAAGMLLGAGLAFYIYQGGFEQWRSLSQPPESTVALTARSYAVWAQAQAGRWYVYRLYDNCAQEPCWVLTKPPPEEEDPYIVEPDSHCTLPPLLLGVQAHAKRCTASGLTELEVYVLRTDGSVWMWTHTVWPILELPLYLLCIGIGTFIGMSLLWARLILGLETLVAA